MKKRTALLLAIAMMLSLAACGTSTTTQSQTPTQESHAPVQTAEATPAPAESTAPAVEPVKLRIAYMPNYASLWAVLTGIDKGYFADEGITIELWEFADGPSEIAAMEGGSIDLAYIGHGAHRLCVQGRATIFAPSSVHDTDSLMVQGNSGINSVADLKGKKVGYNAGSSSESALLLALQLAGLTMDDIEAYEMDATNMVTSMVAGSIDACAAWSPYTFQIMEHVEGARKLEFNSGSVNLSSWICMPDYATGHRDILERFSRALYRAMDFASQEENYPYAAQLCADQTKTDYETNFYQTEDAEWFSISALKERLADGTLKWYYERQQEIFIEGGAIEASDATPVENYVMLDLIGEVLGQLN